MSHYVFYNEFGRIRMFAKLSEIDVEPNTRPGEYVMQVEGAVDPARSYILQGAVTPKTEMPDISVYQTGSIVTISNVPDNCLVIWPDGEITIESGSLTFESNVSGEHKFWFDPVEYMRARKVINVA